MSEHQQEQSTDRGTAAGEARTQEAIKGWVDEVTIVPWEPEDVVTMDRADFDYLMMEKMDAEASVRVLSAEREEILRACREWISARAYWRRPYDVYALVTLGKAEAELERVCLQQELREAQAQ